MQHGNTKSTLSVGDSHCQLASRWCRGILQDSTGLRRGRQCVRITHFEFKKQGPHPRIFIKSDTYGMKHLLSLGDSLSKCSTATRNQHFRPGIFIANLLLGGAEASYKTPRGLGGGANALGLPISSSRNKAPTRGFSSKVTHME